MRVRRRGVQTIALAGAVGVWASSALGQVGPLPKGQRWFLTNGLQSQGMVSPFDSFHLGTYQAMNYTAVNWMWDSNPGDLGAAPGVMPWARWVRPGSPPANSTEFPPIGAEGPYMSNLIALSLGDEPNLNDLTTRNQYVTWFNNVGPSNPNVLLFMNNFGGQVDDASLGDFIARGHPDMVSFDTYPYRYSGTTRVQPAGGSPWNWWSDLRRYRAHADGNNIPLGMYRQAFGSVSEACRDLSDSEFRMMSFGGLAFNVKYLLDFTYNSGASSFFDSNGDTAPNALYSQAAQINAEVKNLGPAMIRLRPVSDWAGYTTSIMFVRGKHDAGVLNDWPIGLQPDSDDGRYTQWQFGQNDPYLVGGFSDSVQNLGAANGGQQGDMIISWFHPLDEWFDGDDYTDERYFMLMNGLGDMDATGAQTRQSIRLDFNFASSGITMLQRLNRLTGQVEDVPLVFDAASGKWQLFTTLDGGTGDLYKFKDGAPFMATLPPDAMWTSATSGSFSTGSNWDVGVAPAGNYLLHFGSAGSTLTSSVTFGGSISAKGAYVHGGNLTWNLAGGTFAQTGTSGLDSLIVGMKSGESPTLTITSGTVSTAAVAGKFAQIGKGAGAVGNVVVGASGNWTSAADLLIGKAGTGTLAVSGAGASATFPNVYLGGTPTAAGGVGAMSVTSGTATVTGTLKIWNTGAAAPNGSRLTLNGGTLNVGTLDTGGVPQRFGWNGGTLGITSASTLNLDGFGPLGSILSISGTKNLRMTSGTLSINGSASVSEFGGGINVNTILLKPLGSYTRSNGTLVFSTFNQTGGTFTHSVAQPLLVAAAGGANYNLSGGNLNVNAAQAIAVGGAISGGTFTQTGGSASAGSIQIVGPSAVLLSGAATLSCGSMSNGSTFSQSGGTATVGPVSGTGTVSVSSGSLTASSIRQQSLNVSGGVATVSANGGDSGVSVVNQLTVSGSGKLDLKDNDLVVNSGNYTTIRGLVLAGFGNNPGITSTSSNGSQILALFDNALVGTGSWAGQTISGNAIVGKYTYFGDVNFDGQVTGDDYTIVDSNLNTTPAVGMEWLSGDANLDGIVTGDDYTTIDSNLGLGTGNPLTANALSSSAVPEPVAMALMLVGGALLCRRRR